MMTVSIVMTLQIGCSKNHVPYFIYVSSELAGLILIHRYPDDLSVYDIDQFFVLRKFKDNGVGKTALEQVVRTFPSKCQIRGLLETSGALNFWKSTVSKIIGENHVYARPMITIY